MTDLNAILTVASRDFREESPPARRMARTGLPFLGILGREDKRVNAALYSVGVNPIDGTVWGTSLGFPGSVVRLDPGSSPPATAMAGRRPASDAARY